MRCVCTCAAPTVANMYAAYNWNTYTHRHTNMHRTWSVIPDGISGDTKYTKAYRSSTCYTYTNAEETRRVVHESIQPVIQLKIPSVCSKLSPLQLIDSMLHALFVCSCSRCDTKTKDEARRGAGHIHARTIAASAIAWTRGIRIYWASTAFSGGLRLE